MIYTLAQRTASALTAAADAGMPENSIISFDWEMIKNLAFIWLNAAVLVVILAVVLYKPVRNFMDQRSAGIQSDLDSAKQAREEAEALKAECEQTLRDIEKEREVILESAYKKAMERSEALLKEAQDEAARLRKSAMGELEEERAAMEEELRRELIELSVMLAERFVSVSIDETVQNELLEKAIEDWEERRWLG